MTKSRVLQKLSTGDFVKVAGISRVMDPWLTEVAGRIGYDAIWLDLEHRPYGVEVINGLSLACRAAGLDLMVRILKGGYYSAMQALEFGANGLMIPHIRSAKEARQWVEWSRFPPLGKRGLDGAGADADFGLADTCEYLKHANKEVFLAFQVEDREAVEAIEEIAAVPGFDFFFIGPGDLSLSYDVPLQFDHPLMQEATRRVAEAAHKNGKWWGTTTPTPAHAQRALDLGARMVVAGGDHGALVNGLRDSFRAFNSISLPTSAAHAR
jgi:4-hydroxy-2-oxoheptanedioate aldolase